MICKSHEDHLHLLEEVYLELFKNVEEQKQYMLDVDLQISVKTLTKYKFKLHHLHIVKMVSVKQATFVILKK